MAELSRAVLKLFFETGDIPTESEFASLIDSLLNLTDDDTDNLSQSATKKFLDNAAPQDIAGVKEFSNLVHANNAANSIKAFTATPTFAFSTDGNDQQMDVEGNITSFITSGEVGSATMKVYLVNDGTPGRTVVAPTGWTADKSSESHSQVADAINLYQFYTLPDGTKFYHLHLVKE
ncbi:hypothetical protein KAR91_14645 [Candidatus Pacearchaeota archaeon]|nr:hypothetical protein [Candidatus Pacearchaeota archaeon]